MKVKKYIALALVSVAAISATLSSCSTEKEADKEIEKNKKRIR